MIIKKVWIQPRHINADFVKGEWTREGWYLFGIIPLYIRDMTPREKRKPRLHLDLPY
jgi:hypothetical protein